MRWRSQKMDGPKGVCRFGEKCTNIRCKNHETSRGLREIKGVSFGRIYSHYYNVVKNPLHIELIKGSPNQFRPEWEFPLPEMAECVDDDFPHPNSATNFICLDKRGTRLRDDAFAVSQNEKYSVIRIAIVNPFPLLVNSDPKILQYFRQVYSTIFMGRDSIRNFTEQYRDTLTLEPGKKCNCVVMSIVRRGEKETVSICLKKIDVLTIYNFDEVDKSMKEDSNSMWHSIYEILMGEAYRDKGPLIIKEASYCGYNTIKEEERDLRAPSSIIIKEIIRLFNKHALDFIPSGDIICEEIIPRPDLEQIDEIDRKTLYEIVSPSSIIGKLVPVKEFDKEKHFVKFTSPLRSFDCLYNLHLIVREIGFPFDIVVNEIDIVRHNMALSIDRRIQALAIQDSVLEGLKTNLRGR